MSKVMSFELILLLSASPIIKFVIDLIVGLAAVRCCNKFIYERLIIFPESSSQQHGVVVKVGHLRFALEELLSSPRNFKPQSFASAS